MIATAAAVAVPTTAAAAFGHGRDDIEYAAAGGVEVGAVTRLGV